MGAYEFKVGDRVRVKEGGLWNVKAAAGLCGYITWADMGCFDLDFDRDVPNDDGYSARRWAANIGEIEPIHVTNTPRPGEPEGARDRGEPEVSVKPGELVQAKITKPWITRGSVYRVKHAWCDGSVSLWEDDEEDENYLELGEYEPLGQGYIPPEAPSEPQAPSSNPKDAIGRQKPSIHAVPPLALLYLGAAMADGERKYGLMNYRESPVDALVYYDAAVRHLLRWLDGEEVAEDSGLPHLAHVMANMAILLDAKAQGTLIDTRPTPGKVAEVIEGLMKLREDQDARRTA